MRRPRKEVISAAIFDLDGTLVDSNDLHVQAWQETFRHFGKEIPVEKLREQIGKGGDQYLPVFLSEKEMREIGKEVDEFRGKIFKEKYLPRVRPFPRVRELFERVRGDGKKIALASSGKADEVELLSRNSPGIEGLVDCQTTADDVAHSKPKADVFIAALRSARPFDAGGGDRDRGHALRYRGGEEDRSGDDRTSLRWFSRGRSA